MGLRKDSVYKHRRIGGRSGKMTPAHHIIWKQSVGPIKEGNQIHHLDHDRSNNDLGNLIELSASDHQKFHSPHYAKNEIGEWVKICYRCKQIRKPDIRSVCNPCRAAMARIERRKRGVNER